MKLEPRYYVLKLKDLQDAINAGLINQEQVESLQDIQEAINLFRWENRKKGELECAVVESDWPMYQQVVNELLSK